MFCRVAAALARHGGLATAVVDDLVLELRGPAGRRRRAALRALVAIGPHVDAAAELNETVVALRPRDVVCEQEWDFVLARLRLGPAPSEHEIATAFAGDEAARFAGFRAVRERPEVSEDFVAVVRAAYESAVARWFRRRADSREVALEASLAIVKHFDDGALARRANADLLHHYDDHLRLAAFLRLRRYGCPPPGALPLVVAALQDPDRRVQREAVFALALYGDRALGAVSVLERLQRDRDRELRLAATRARRQIVEDASVAARLVTSFAAVDHDERRALAARVRALGAAAVPYLADVLFREAMRLTSRSLVCDALDMLEALGASARAADDALSVWCWHADHDLASWAVATRKNIRAAAKD